MNEMKPESLTIALVQMTCSADRAENLDNIEIQLRAAAAHRAQLVLLPELHNHRYFCQTENPDNFDLAESIPGPTTAFIGKLANELNLVIVASLFEKRASGLYHNTAVVLESDGSIAGTYRKMHIPDDPGYHEKFYFTPGDTGFQPINTSVGTLGVLICWDQWFPEASRLMALAGADLLLYPTAIGWDVADTKQEQQRQLDAWITIQRAHAIANGIPVLACNRSGIEADPGEVTQGISFWGSSFAAGPQGEILARANTDTAELVLIDIDLSRSETIRRIWPYFRDRRIDAYSDLDKRFRD